ncbi:hypothetical protein BN7_3909 [Wickerhamomyces ciferrii]|uniref:Uncharacterized protein n=1 Tax=Wickerhamomyces ciferrii (strain ATCC 14091 / BCRC 22168 / CBS 111 / JCM 3599 / NBRC 0793 / NRRL Y-1031 F-60-10) TaxID=1206466 RepID=K0KN06_WICCF|nr:uncharacterized protein BN7_3909 [Wickerhamomyces ciferrii]CCH44346.1 hypothetical protein BN7_3909 [Wickerhamomyces ciferrii]
MSDEGASFKEQILDVARRNNTELFDEILANAAGEQISDIINHSKDALGNTPLHLAAKYGSFEVLDTILDQEGTEVDPVNVIDGDTPLHLAVRYSETEPEHGAFIAETLIEAGADARIKNKGGFTPVQLIHNENPQLRELLQSAEYAAALEQEGQLNSEYYFQRDLNEKLTLKDEDDGPSDDEGSASDSD